MNDIISPKCCNASYCKYSKNGINCSADDRIIEECLYLQAINKITELSMELANTYDDGK